MPPIIETNAMPPIIETITSLIFLIGKCSPYIDYNIKSRPDIVTESPHFSYGVTIN